MAFKRGSFSLNPNIGHFAAAAVFTCALVLGIFRFFVLDRIDPLHCNALLSKGRWLDDNFTNWQPDGCMLYDYQPEDVSACLGSRRVVFIGDSVTRLLYFRFAHTIDPLLPTAPPEDSDKHSDYNYMTAGGIELSFYWAPYLNTSTTFNQFRPSGPPGRRGERPALLVMGSGLWYLRYPSASGGLPAWESNIQTTIEAIQQAHPPSADMVVVLPVEDIFPPKSSPSRATTIHGADVDAMNSDLAHRIRPSSDPFAFFGRRPPPPDGPFVAPSNSPIWFPSVFNTMIDTTQTEDGLHYSAAVVTMHAQILLNLRCNDVLPKVFPLDKTCCRSYPWPSLLHSLVVTGFVLWWPVLWFLSHRYNAKTVDSPLIPKDQMSIMVISASVAVVYLADRTGFWLKEQKQYNPWTFAFLSLISLVVGLLTVKRGDNDLGFLNRDQTDEWKGWMQIVILIYHYVGASKVSGIYNPIRVLIAAYLFMTGYGHTMFYLKKADYGLTRVARVLIRVNLFTLILVYTMNTDYQSYYFSPLISWWYITVYATMLVGAQFNDRIVFLITKIILSMVVLSVLMKTDWLLELIFSLLEQLCGIHWSAREWALRINLDTFIVYAGMLTAALIVKCRELHWTEHRLWSLITKAGASVSVLVLIWFFAFELTRDGFSYNTWHPFVSFLPIGAFAILRNANTILRSGSSRVFMFIGKCSLETYIIQYHFWLAGDKKGILLVIPGTRWRPLNMVFTSIIFIYLSHHVAKATGDITKWICGDQLAIVSLPPPVNAPQPRGTASNADSEAQEIIFETSENLELPPRKDNEGNTLPLEPDTPVRAPRRWVDRLAEGTRPQSPPSIRLWYGEKPWYAGLKARLLMILGVMWILNVFWWYPPKSSRYT
ncbi:O-acetyltransferase [Irpex rosettiformis]|uniref:O-acetyltransferase n=1 Tax=Irpex rosettiformis TaxID=378272 RepID=A0ACB8ULA2_9APHY|nr:O-acetyltransferase [Irpex rosettiformis]